MENKTSQYVSSETANKTVERMKFKKDVLRLYREKPISELDSILLCSAAISSEVPEEKQMLLEEVLRKDEFYAYYLKKTIDDVFIDDTLRDKFMRDLILKLADTIAKDGERYQGDVEDEGKELVKRVYMRLIRNDNERKKFIREYATILRDLVYKSLIK